MALGEADRAEAATQLLEHAETKLAPAHWQAEVANVVWKANRMGRLADADVDTVMVALGSLHITSVSVLRLWRGAVARAVAVGHPVYDTLYVELAVREGVALASFDRRLRELFPDIVRDPAELVG